MIDEKPKKERIPKSEFCANCPPGSRHKKSSHRITKTGKQICVRPVTQSYKQTPDAVVEQIAYCTCEKFEKLAISAEEVKNWWAK